MAHDLPEGHTRITLGLGYEGSLYRGWQTQPCGQTIQDTLQHALHRFVGRPCMAVCAGRTDTGVHALQQVVHIDTPVQRSQQSWVRGLNSALPDTIRVQWAHPVSEGFHARFSARSRTYLYVVRNHPIASPFMAKRVGWVYRPLQLAPMQAAARSLVGHHDFSSFRSSQCQATHPNRTLHQLDIIEQAPYFLFVFHANAFLHHMVRNIMGALISIGQGRHSPEWISDLLEQRDRRLAAPTFAASGLYLADVNYPADHGLPRQPWSERLHALTGISIDAPRI